MTFSYLDQDIMAKRPASLQRLREVAAFEMASAQGVQMELEKARLEAVVKRRTYYLLMVVCVAFTITGICYLFISRSDFIGPMQSIVGGICVVGLYVSYRFGEAWSVLRASEVELSYIERAYDILREETAESLSKLNPATKSRS